MTQAPSLPPYETHLASLWHLADPFTGRQLARIGFAAMLLLASADIDLQPMPPPAHATESAPVAEITLSMVPLAEISPLIYGVNYDWDRVPAGQFQQWQMVMENVAHYTLARFPSGWNAEWYDWASNRLVGGNRHSDSPGADAETILSAGPMVSFIAPSETAISRPAELGSVVSRTVQLVNQYGNRVPIWEIGNEWWLQSGAKKNLNIREHHLRAYAALVAADVPAMKAANGGIQIYATGDWTEPEEFARLRDLVRPDAWAALDGISIHTYCGTVEQLCGRIIDSVDEIKAVTGKQKIYDSEWAVVKRLSSDDYGIRNANETVLTLQDIAFSHIVAATYWPTVKSVPALNFVSEDFQQPFATGIIFGWMSHYYRGEALRTGGDLAAVAARSNDVVTVLVPSRGIGPRTVRISLAGTGLSRVVSAEVMYSEHPDEPDESRLVSISLLSTQIRRGGGGQQWVEFVVNPGTPGRGSNWEIARVTLR
jgi:hypothetical protein